MWYFLFLAGLTIAVIAIWPFSMERRRTVIGPTERHGAAGEFAQLSQGVTHYRWMGSSRGPVAVVVHGLATPMDSMESVAEGLGTLGYRVLLYDLYGRGLSDAPGGLQDRAYFHRQLSDLLAYHGLTEELTLVGYSMGGSIVTAYAAEHPFLVKRVILFATTGLVVNETWFARFCRRTPILGDWLHALLAQRRIERAIPERGQTKEIDKVLRAQRRELHRRGYLPGILSSRRGMLSEVQHYEHTQLGKKGIPVIAIWAESDSIIPLSALGKLAEWNRNARHEVVPHADHALPYSHGRELIEALRDALRN
ncbi:alpha/beta fold hydrolase [Yoonia litorea]|uniref:Pimeloyl-ACP methyl ester carboxylesterase n=1 Tax=Yoonia litorea TaxID=1123755 RepID=A0A1I6L1P7_9RHOB|nr:alpha/beta hydrolase [Yoonia litorea]SFR97389.1 Pimeloyl-ACP methyl ester carboxylesterase [Yoonia litorea]